jgi:hypothetical protein
MAVENYKHRRIFLGSDTHNEVDKELKERSESIQPEGFADAVVPGKDPTINCGFILTLGQMSWVG